MLCEAVKDALQRVRGIQTRFWGQNRFFRLQVVPALLDGRVAPRQFFSRRRFLTKVRLMGVMIGQATPSGVQTGGCMLDNVIEGISMQGMSIAKGL